TGPGLVAIDKDFANVAGPVVVADQFGDRFSWGVATSHFPFNFGEKIDGVFGAATAFLVTALAAEAPAFRDGHAGITGVRERGLKSSNLCGRPMASIFSRITLDDFAVD